MISITLPSIFPDALDRTLANIRATTRGDYEVIVVSPFEVTAPNTVWVHERERNGCAYAHTVAAHRAKGQFITATADDCDYLPGWDLEVLTNFATRDPQNGKPFCLGLHYGLVGSVFGIYYANFPFMRRTEALKLGYFDGNYKKGFTDSDLGLKVWTAGGRCEYTKHRTIEITALDKRKGGEDCPDDDLGYFVQKWGAKYGRGFDTSYMRAINVDVDPDEHPEFVTDWTIFRNKPKLVSEMAFHSPPHLVDTINKINIVRYRGCFLYVPQSLGPVDLRISGQDLPGIRQYKTIAQARRAALDPDEPFRTVNWMKRAFQTFSSRA